MEMIHVALVSLALGAVLGVALAVIVLLSYRARVLAGREASARIPVGISAVLDSMDDAACVVDSSHTVRATSAAARHYGIVPDAPLDNDELRSLLRRARSTRSPQAETLRITPPGSVVDPRLISARASVLGPRLMLLVIRDVTAQERIDQMRSDFVANTSHELKTPVGAVLLLAEAIGAAAEEPDQVRAFADRLLAEAGRLRHLTGRILTLARLQAASGIATSELVELDAVVSRSIEAHLVEAGAVDVELLRGGERGVRVVGDTQILVEAVSNLVSNAIAASPRGSRVVVAVRRDDEVAEISVTDQGAGIAEADRERIFERFYRADQARSSRTGGTGLGLSIVKHATSHHGGEVRLWSRVGRGSTFTMRLPRADVPGRGKRAKKRKKKARKEQSA